MLKSLIISKIGFEIEMRGIPEKYKKRNKQCHVELYMGGESKFNWKERMLLTVRRRGISMINIDSFIKSKQIKSMQKILRSKTDNWNTIAKWWLQKFDIKYNCDIFFTKVFGFTRITNGTFSKILSGVN